MILINLLPHREERRKRRKVAFFAGLGVAAAIGVGVAGAWFLVVQHLTNQQVERNAFLTSEIQKLELQIKDIANLKAEIESLKARQKAVEDLQTDRNVPVHILNELVKHTPEGVYFRSMKQENQALTLAGVAQTQERISELLRNTGNNTEWLVKPELVESKAANIGGRQVFDFSMKLSIKRPQDQPAAAGAASAPAPAAAAVAKKV